MSFAQFTWSISNTDASFPQSSWLVALSMLGKLAITSAYGTAYIFSTELFPTRYHDDGDCDGNGDDDQKIINHDTVSSLRTETTKIFPSFSFQGSEFGIGRLLDGRSGWQNYHCVPHNYYNHNYQCDYYE